MCVCVCVCACVCECVCVCVCVLCMCVCVCVRVCVCVHVCVCVCVHACACIHVRCMYVYILYTEWCMGSVSHINSMHSKLQLTAMYSFHSVTTTCVFFCTIRCQP